MLRDKFAMAAMQGILSNQEFNQGCIRTAKQSGVPVNAIVAASAYEFADAMMMARKGVDFSDDPEAKPTGTIESDTPIRKGVPPYVPTPKIKYE